MQSPVPGFSNSLSAMAGFLAKAEAHCAAHKIDPAVLLSSRLFPNMLTLTRNVLIASDSAKGATARLSGTENPSYSDDETTFEELYARIEKTLKFMRSVPESLFEGAEDREVILRVGGSEKKYIGQAYLVEFAIPNFYFHVSTAFGILRHNGVEIGKADFLGGL